VDGAEVAGDAGLRVGVLGPLLVVRDGVAVRLPRGRVGVLLAVLAMSAGRPVGADRLAGLLWDDDRPEHLRASLNTVVARMRRMVPGAVVTVGDGYLLDISPDHVDVLRFRRLAREAGGADDRASALGLFDRALDLWRGEPLADLGSAALARDVVPGLTDEYLSAVQRRADLRLEAGQGDRVIAELRELTARHPLREPLWGQLLRALAVAGRPAEAITEYHRARETLVARLGIDPSPELQGLYRRLLQADRLGPPAERLPDPPAGPPLLMPEPSFAAPGLEQPEPSPPGDHAPQGDAASGNGPARGALRRLPADTGVFTGRQAELMRLLELGEGNDGGRGPGAVVIWALDGMAGVGKTALAVHAAHRLAERFADGQLFIDLHGYTQGYPPRTADQALETFLRTLGIPPRQIPQSTEERAALYRGRLAGTRTLIVLDNAADEAQVRPLIPGDAGCLVLITSRRKLKSLDDAHVVALDVLPDADAVTLLAAVAGPGRIAAGDRDAAEVVRLCGRLPLAVRIAGALLRSRPAWTLAHLTGTLHAARANLDSFSDGDRNLAAVFGLSRLSLGDDQGRLYRYLGLIPGPEIDAYGAAALADTDLVTADRLLQGLVDHNLLLEPVAGRYEMHDLIRAHARTLAEHDPADERQAALDRLLDYYQHTALRADAHVARYAQSVPPGPTPRHAPALAGDGSARTWLRAERANLGACLRYAVDVGLAERVVALSAGLANLLRTEGPWPTGIDVQAAAANAAARLGDQSGRARALTELGNLQGLTDDYPGAKASLQAALELLRETGDKAGEAHALTELASMQRMDDNAGAEASLRAALELYRETGDRVGEAHALIRLGAVQNVSGDPPGAEANLQAALKLHRETGDKTGEAHALIQLIQVQRLTGEYEDAVRNGESALVIVQGLGDRLYLATALNKLGVAHCLVGDYASAARNQRAAHEVYRELGNRLGQANALTGLAEARRLTGDQAGAARDLEEAIGIFQDLGIRGSEAWALNYYAAVIADTGDPGRAIAVYHDALRLAREVRQPDDEAIALQGLGEAHARMGESEDGVAYLREALGIFRRLGMSAAEQVTKRLAEIGALLAALTGPS
jgi:DNA-binding SARP family transcriptional activator/tetratricopeptide (TPR) repeat protein